MKTIGEQVACARAILARREKELPKRVAGGRMTSAEVDHEIECARSMVGTLEMVMWLREVSEAMKARPGGNVQRSTLNAQLPTVEGEGTEGLR